MHAIRSYGQGVNLEKLLRKRGRIISDNVTFEADECVSLSMPLHLRVSLQRNKIAINGKKQRKKDRQNNVVVSIMQVL